MYPKRVNSWLIYYTSLPLSNGRAQKTGNFAECAGNSQKYKKNNATAKILSISAYQNRKID